MVVTLSFLGSNLKPVNSTWLGLYLLIIKFRKEGTLNEDCYSSIRNYALTYPELRSWSRSRKESEVSGLSRSQIPNNTGSQSRIFLSDFNSGCPIGSFLTQHS